MNSNQDRIFDWYEFLKHDLKPDKVNINLHSSAIGAAEGTDHRQEPYDKLSQMISEDSRTLRSRTTMAAKPDSSRRRSMSTCTN
jgi:hypothetical protein